MNGEVLVHGRKKDSSRVLILLTIFYALGLVLAYLLKKEPIYYNVLCPLTDIRETAKNVLVMQIIPLVILLLGLTKIGRVLIPAWIAASGFYLGSCVLEAVDHGIKLSPYLIPRALSGLMLIFVIMSMAAVSFSGTVTPISLKRHSFNLSIIKKRLLLFLILAALSSGVIILSETICSLYV